MQTSAQLQLARRRLLLGVPAVVGPETRNRG